MPPRRSSPPRVLQKGDNFGREYQDVLPQGCNAAGMKGKKPKKCNQNSLRLQTAWSNRRKAPESGLREDIHFKPRCHRRSTSADNSGCDRRQGAQGPRSSRRIHSAWLGKAQAAASFPSLGLRATLLVSLSPRHGGGSPLLQPHHGKVGPSHRGPHLMPSSVVKAAHGN